MMVECMGLVVTTLLLSHAECRLSTSIYHCAQQSIILVYNQSHPLQTVIKCHHWQFPDLCYNVKCG